MKRILKDRPLTRSEHARRHREKYPEKITARNAKYHKANYYSKIKLKRILKEQI